jgi:GAF domain-containing protein
VTRETDAIRGLIEAGSDLAETSTFETTLRVTVEAAARLTGAEHGCLALLGRGDAPVDVVSTEPEGPGRDGVTPLPRPADVLSALAGRLRRDVPTWRGDLPGPGGRLPALGGVIALQDEVLGALCLVGKRGGDAFTHDDEMVLHAFLQHAALGIANACLRWRAEERADKLRVLSTLTRFVTSTTASGQVFDAVARAAVVLVGARAARVWIDAPAQHGLRVGGSFGIDPEVDTLATDRRVIPYRMGVVGSVYRTRTPAYLLDVLRDDRWVNRRLVELAGLHTFAGLPLMVEHRAVGVLAIFFERRPGFSADERELMHLLADQAAITVWNQRLLEETERRRQVDDTFVELARRLSRSLGAPHSRQAVADSLRALLGARSAELFRIDLDTGEPICIATAGDAAAGPGGAAWSRLAARWLRAAVRQRRSLATPDARAGLAPDGAGGREAGAGIADRALLCVPVLFQDRVVGALCARDRTGRDFDAEEIRLAEALATYAALGIDSKLPETVPGR